MLNIFQLFPLIFVRSKRCCFIV